MVEMNISGQDFLLAGSAPYLERAKDVRHNYVDFALLAKVQVGWKMLLCKGMELGNLPGYRDRSLFRRRDQLKSVD